MEHHFRQDEMVSAQRELGVLLGKTEKLVTKRLPGAGRSATKGQALETLSNQATMPRFLVQ
jgi:hypothetical protein